MENSFFVYVDLKPCGTPFYIGKGTIARVNRKNRVNRHHTNICNKHPNWYRGIAYFGSEEGAFAKEKQLIAYFGRDNLCNQTDGGEGLSGRIAWNKGIALTEKHKLNVKNSLLGKKHSDLTKEKMSKAHKGNNHAKGYKHTEEALSKMSKASKSHVRTPEWKAKIAASIKSHWELRKGINNGTK